MPSEAVAERHISELSSDPLRPLTRDELDHEEYPDEFIEELENDIENTYLQIKAGKKPYVPLEELALKFGVDLKNG